MEFRRGVPIQAAIPPEYNPKEDFAVNTNVHSLGAKSVKVIPEAAIRRLLSLTTFSESSNQRLDLVSKPILYTKMRVLRQLPFFKDLVSREDELQGNTVDGNKAYQENLKKTKSLANGEVIQGAVFDQLEKQKDIIAYKNGLKYAKGDEKLQILFKLAQANLLRHASGDNVQVWIENRDAIRGNLKGESQQFSLNELIVDVPNMKTMRSYLQADICWMSECSAAATDFLLHAIDGLIQRERWFEALGQEWSYNLESVLSRLPKFEEIREYLFSLQTVQTSPALSSLIRALPKWIEEEEPGSEKKYISHQELVILLDSYRGIFKRLQEVETPFQDLKKIKEYQARLEKIDGDVMLYQKCYDTMQAGKTLNLLIDDIKVLRKTTCIKQGDFSSFFQRYPAIVDRLIQGLGTIVNHSSLPDEMRVLYGELPQIRTAFLLRATAYERIGRLLLHYYQDLPDDTDGIEANQQRKNMSYLLYSTAEEYFLAAYSDYRFGKTLLEPVLSANSMTEGALSHELKGIYKKIPQEFGDELIEKLELSGRFLQIQDSIRDEVMVCYKNLIGDCKEALDRILSDIRANQAITSKGIQFLLQIGDSENPETIHAMGNWYYNGRERQQRKKTLEKEPGMGPVPTLVRESLYRYSKALELYQKAHEQLMAKKPMRGATIEQVEEFHQSQEMQANRYRVSIKKAGLFLRATKAIARIARWLEVGLEDKQQLEDLTKKFSKRGKISPYIIKKIKDELEEAISLERRVVLARMEEEKCYSDVLQPGRLATDQRIRDEYQWLLNTRSVHEQQVDGGEIAKNEYNDYRRYGKYQKKVVQSWYRQKAALYNPSNLRQLYQWQAKVLDTLGEYQEAYIARQKALQILREKFQDKNDYEIDWEAFANLRRLDGIRKGEIDIDS